MDLDLSCYVAGIKLNSPIMNASGVCCTTVKQIEELDESQFLSAIVTKSCTMTPREGNPKPRYYGTSSFSINSMGLANMSLKYYLKVAETFSKSKPVFLSLAGLSAEENVAMVKNVAASEQHASGVELNLSCPNVPNKPQIAYDFEAMGDILNRVFEVDLGNMPLGVKLPPYFDPVHFHQSADVLRNYPKLRWVTCINSIGNGLYIDPITEETVIHPKKGLGGLGGSFVKPTALANVKMFRELLPEQVDIIGCGGVLRGMDIFEHILCGASAVQVGTYLQENGIDGIPRLYHEFKDVMILKEYHTLDDFRGRLKTSPTIMNNKNDPAS
jgi:dihydroorotate dehydrogenase (fumarate)